jgi:hypothetical protein
MAGPYVGGGLGYFRLLPPPKECIHKPWDDMAESFQKPPAREPRGVVTEDTISRAAMQVA